VSFIPYPGYPGLILNSGPCSENLIHPSLLRSSRHCSRSTACVDSVPQSCWYADGGCWAPITRLVAETFMIGSMSDEGSSSWSVRTVGLFKSAVKARLVGFLDLQVYPLSSLTNNRRTRPLRVQTHQTFLTVDALNGHLLSIVFLSFKHQWLGGSCRRGSRRILDIRNLLLSISIQRRQRTWTPITCTASVTFVIVKNGTCSLTGR
jgi:hypothetical protein